MMRCLKLLQNKVPYIMMIRAMANKQSMTHYENIVKEIFFQKK
jgi:hypothetical protein